MIFNYYLTEDFMAFAHAQVMWQRHAGNPLEILINGYHENIYTAFEAAFATIAISIFILLYRKIRFSYWLFGIYSIFVPLSTVIQSMPRFILVISLFTFFLRTLLKAVFQKILSRYLPLFFKAF